MSQKTWKDYLLRSGLPLENDVKRILASQGCGSAYEYSYLKQDENLLEKEFSYDIDAAFIRGMHFFELMIECKYRHESTKWVFAPTSYGGLHGINPNAFLHANDHFVPHKFPYNGTFPISFAPVCGKGVEITSNGDNEKTIVQAMHQLSYAFAEKVATAFESAVFRRLVDDHIFYHLPIIVTTADLWRLKDDADIAAIKNSVDLLDVAEQHNILIIQNTTGVQLEQFNNEIFEGFRDRVGDEALHEKLSTQTEDLDHFFAVISRYYCPSSFVVMKYDEQGASFDLLFKYLDLILDPDADLKEKLLKQEIEEEKMMAEIDEMMKED